MFARGSRIVQKGLEAQFDPAGLQDHEKAEAASKLSFHGLPEDAETGREVDPYSRLSLFDSKQAQTKFRWSDEEHDLVVQTLRESDRLGLDYIEVSAPLAKLPWASYDSLDDAEQIAELTIATGTTPADVIAYERENQNREDVLLILRDLLDGSEDEDEAAVTIEA